MKNDIEKALKYTDSDLILSSDLNTERNTFKKFEILNVFKMLKMEKEPDFRMKEALNVNIIYPKLLQIGISQRDVDYLDRDEQWMQLKYRNHQIYFLRVQFATMASHELSIRELMNIFNLSETPVRRAIKAGFKLPEEPGRHPSLKNEIEINLVKIILQREIDENPILPCEFRKYVNETYKEKLTTGWIHTFLTRHIEDIQKAKSFPLDDYRCSVPLEYLTKHIENMHNYVEGKLAELVFNIDEMGSSDWEDRKVRKVLISSKTDPNSIFHKVCRRYKHQTLVSVVSAAGDSLTPMIISSTDVYKELKKNGYRQNEDASFRVRNSPYVNEDLFKDYLITNFFPYIDELRKNEEFTNELCVLLMDNDAAHVSEEILKLLAQNRVMAITFPAHTTNIFQMLDLVLFGSLKKIKESEKSDIDPKHAANFTDRLLHAFEKAMIPQNIRGSFKRAGFTIDTSSNPFKLHFDEEVLKENPGYKELVAANISVEDLSARRRNNIFGWINQQYFDKS